MSQPFAHRGLHDPEKGIIENTRSAIEASITHGFGFETDLRPAACGEIMVFHDARLERLTKATGAFDQHNKQQLQALSFKGTSDKMMSLPELLALVEGQVPMLLEIKSDWQMSASQTEQFVRNIARPLQTYKGPFAVMSFDPAIVLAFLKLAPEIPRGLISEQYNDARTWHFLSLAQRLSQRFLLSALRTRPNFIAYDIKSLPALAPIVARRFWQCPLLTWTVRTPEQEKRAQKYCDAMIFEGILPNSQQPEVSADL